jgi:hypothetical protein
MHQNGNIMDSKHNAATEFSTAQQEPWSLPMKEHQQPRSGPQDTATKTKPQEAKKQEMETHRGVFSVVKSRGGV